MSTNATPVPVSLVESSTAPAATKALIIGAVGLGLTVIGALVSPDKSAVALSYLVGVTFWTAMALGFLLMVFIHHITDASWSVVIRRQWEHGLAAFKWLGLLFAPLVIV